MKDLFIDNNIAKNFANPLDPEYKKLIVWLMYSPEAFLVTCNRLIGEYGRTGANAMSATCIWVILNKTTIEGRRNHITNEYIKKFKAQHYKKHIIKNFTCSISDREYIPTVLLSQRKYALTGDINFKNDLENFPRFKARAEMRPEDLPYQ